MEDKNKQVGGITPSDASLQASYSAGLPADLQFDPQALSAEPTVISPQDALVNEQTFSGAANPRFNAWLRRGAFAIAALVLLGAAVFVVTNANKRDNGIAGENATGRFETTTVPLDDIHVEPIVNLSNTKVVTINGKLTIKEGLVVAPTVQPANAEAGQIYYDINNNTLAYFNGTSFVSVGGNVVKDINTLTGNIPLGAGLADIGGQLVNTGVLSVQGLNGNVTLTAGQGIGINGTTISNDGVISLVSINPTLTVTDDGNGNFTLDLAAGGGTGTVTSGGGTAGRITKFTAGQNIEDSLLSESGATVTVNGDLSVTGTLALSTPLSVANGGTGATALGANGVLVGNGSAAITSVVAGAAGLCLVSTAGAPAWATCNPPSTSVNSLNGLTGTLNIANATGLVNTITIDDASTANKGIAQFNGTNFNVVGGNVNTVQNIATTSSPTFNSLTLSGNLTVQGGTSTLGTTTQAGSIVLSDGTSNTVTIVASNLSANRIYTLPDAGGDATLCVTAGNCIGGTGSAPNGADYLVATLSGTLTNERALAGGTNISLTDGGANGSMTVATVNNPTFSTSVTTPTLQSSGALVITSAGGGTVAVDAATTIELQDSTNVTGSLDVSVALNVGTANAFAVNSSGAITAAAGITSSGTIIFSALNCTGNANGGALTANGSGQIVCSDDDGGGGGSITGSGVSGTIPVFNGATNITNSIITQSGTTISIAGDLTLTTDLTVANGGTGASSFTSNGVLYGNGSGALNVTAAGTSGQVLVANGSGVPTFVSFTGDVNVAANGATTIQANSVALGTDTTGDYVSNLGTLTGLSTSGNSGEGSTPTLSVIYGSLANTAVQGNVTLNCPSGTGNLTGGGTSITLGTGGTCGSLSIVNNPTFTTSVTTPSLILTGAGSNGTIQVGNLGQGTVYTLPDPGGAAATICISTGNCATAGAAGGDLTGTYPNPTIAKLQNTNLNINTPLAGHILVWNGTNGAWENHAVSGDIAISETGASTIQANSVALGTDTTGNYVIGLTAGNGVSVTGSAGEAWSPTVTVLYGSSANTAVEGNTSITVSAGTNLTGGGSITLGAGGTVTLNVANSPTFSGTLTVQGATATVGTSSQQGSVVLNDGSSNTGTVQTAALGQDTTYTLPDPGGASATFCLSSGNCAAAGAAGGDLTGTYPNPTIAKLQNTTLTISSLTSGDILQYNGSAWVNQSLSGDVVLNSSGVAAIQANSVALGTDTTGNYVATLGTLTGLTTTGNTGEGSTPTLSVTYGSGANTSVQGNTSITVTAGTNLTGGGSITLGAGGTVTLDVANSPTFSGTLTVQGASATIGGASQLGSLILNDGSSNTGTLRTAALAADRIYTLPDPGGNADICLSTGNCAGTGGGVTTGGGTTNQLAKFTGSQTIGDSLVSDDGSTVTITGSGNFVVQGGTGTFGTTSQAGTLVVSDGSSNTVSIVAAALAGNRTYTLPDAGGAADFCLSSGNCVGGAGGAPNAAEYLVLSLNGTLSNERALTAGSNINFTDAGANSTLTVATVQNPTFTTSVTTPILQSSGALAISSGSGTVAIDATTTIELQDATNVTGVLDVSASLNVGTSNAFVVSSGGAITAATGITSSGTITFSGLDCTTFANGGNVTTNASGVLSCSDDDGAAANTITGTGTNGTVSLFTGTNTIADSIITQTGGNTIAIAGTLNLTNDLTVANGGTGASSFTSNGVLYGNGSGALSVTAAGTSGQVLVASALGVPTFVSFSGDVNVAANGATTIQANSVALGTDTTGDYVSNLGTLTGLNTSGNSGEGSTPSLSVIYGSAANTAVQGNTTLTCPSGTGNLTGGGTSITLGTGGTCANLNTINNPTFSTSVTTPSLILTGAGSNGTLQVASLGQATAYTLPDPGGASATICLSTGNCTAAGSAGGDLTGTYPNPTIAKLQNTNLSINTPLAGHILVWNATNGAWENHAVSGDIAISETGVSTIQANSVALGTDTTGNYVLGLSAGNGVSVTGSAGEGWTPTVAVLYGSSANTAVEGNTSITVTAGTNLTGGGSITLGVGGTVTLNVASSPTFSGTLTVQGATTTIGTSSQQGSLVLNDGSSNTGTLKTAALAADRIYTLPDPGGNADICLSTGNCTAAGTAGGDLTGSYPNPTIDKLQGVDLNIVTPLAGHILIYNATNTAWENHAVSSDIVISETGVATIQANSIALGTDTTGDYVSALGSLTGLSTTGNSGEGSTPTLSVLYGSGANTAVQGNVSLTCPSGTGNLSGGGTSITLGAGGTCGNITITNSPTFSGTLTVNTIDATGAMTIGNVGQTLTLQGNATTKLTADNGGNTTTVDFTTPTADTTIHFPALSAGTYTLCTSSGNCGGVGATLQTAYNNTAGGTAEIVLDSTRAALTVRDNVSPIGGNLFEVQNNGASTTYFAVTSAGIETTGTMISSGNINTTGGSINTGAGAGTQRITNAGDLVNIGTLNSQTISSTSNFTGTVTIQGTNALTLGTASTNTGAILFKGSGSANTLTFIGPASPTTNTITLPNETGTVCTTGSVCSGYAPGTGSTVYATRALDNLASVNINAALGFQSNQTANINFNGAAATTGNLLSITGQTAGATANNGGAITIQGGTATTTGTGGLLTLSGGNTTATGTNGGVTIDAGSGATTANGTINLGTANASIINVGSVGSTAKATTIHIADTSDATVTQTITIGSNSNAANVTTIRGGNGTGAITFTPQTTGTIVMGAAAGTGSITLGSSTAAQTVILGGGTGASTVQIANNVATATGNTVSIAGGATATGLTDTINIGTGNTAGTGAKVIHIGDGTPAGTGTNTVTIGSNANTANVTTIQGGNGTGAIALTPQTTGTIVIGAAAGTGNITLGSSTATQSVLIGNGTGASTVSIANNVATATGNTVNVAGGATATGLTDTINIGTGNTAGTGAKVIHIGDGNPAGTGTNTITIGSNANTANTTTIKGGNGAGAITFTPQTTGTIVMGAAAGTGSITLGSSTAAQTVIVGGGTGASTVQIANNVATATGNTVSIAGGATATGTSDTINIATGNTVGTGSKVVHIADGTPAGTNSVTIGSIAATANTTTIQGGNGAGAISLQTAASGTIGIGSNNTANTIQIGSTTLSSGTQTIGIGNNNTAGGTTNVTIGSGSSAAGGATILQAKGALTLTGGAASTFGFGANTLGITSSNFNVSTGGVLNVVGGSAGFQIGGAAATGNYLRGNGTSFVSSAIAFGDIPTCGGTCNYIGNQTSQQSSANFNILSAAAGSIGGLIQGAASQTAANLVLKGGSTPGANADLLQLQTSAATVAKIDNAGDLLAGGAATGTTATTSGTGTNTTTVTLSGSAFANNDVIFIDNAGQDFYTRIVSGGGTATLTVSPAVTFETARTVTKYTIQNIGATQTDYTTQGNRFFQGYFTGGIVTGSGSTIYSDQNINSSGSLAVTANGVNIVRNDTADELEVGDDVFNLNDSNSRINLASTANDSYIRMGESSLLFGFLGWQNSINSMRLATFGSNDIRLETNSTQRINISGAGVTSVTGVASNGVAGFSVDSTQTSALGTLQPGNTLNAILNPGGTATPSYFGNQLTVGIGAAGTTFTGDIIANLGQVNWSGATNTSNTGKLYGTVGKVVTASGAGSVQNAVALFSQLQYAGGTTVTNSYNVYAGNLQSGSTTNLYGFYADQMTGGTNNYPLYLASGTANQPLLSVNGTGATTFQNSTNSTAAFQVQNTLGQSALNIDTTTSNLITNPSIEVNTTGWSAKGAATISRITTQYYAGNASLQAATTAAAGDGAKFTYSLASSTQYSFSVLVKTDVSAIFGNALEIGRSDNGSADTSCSTNQALYSDHWARYTCTFTTGTVSGSPYVYVKQVDANARNLWIDGAQLETAASATRYLEGKTSIGSLAVNASQSLISSSTATMYIQAASGGEGVLLRGNGDGNVFQNALQVTTASGTTIFNVNDTSKGAGFQGGSGFLGAPALSVASTDNTARALDVLGTIGQSVDIMRVKDVFSNKLMVVGANAGSLFNPKIDYTTATTPSGSASADLDKDGDIDLAVTNNSSTSISVFLNNGAGAFAAKVDYTTGTSPWGITAADLDKDGDIDLAVTNNGTTTMSVFLNNGSGAFAAKVDYTTGTNPQGITAGDLDKDGDVDLAVANNSSTSMSVFLNNGAGTFAAKVDYTTGSGPYGITSADLDKDGDIDMVVGNSGPNNLSVLLNNGNGTYAAKVDYTTGTSPNSLTAGDFDKDGDMDVAVTNFSSNTVSILMNNGNGTLATKVDYTTGAGPSGLTSADLDKDGDIDLAVTNSSTTTASVLLNNGNGTYAAKVDYTTGTSPNSLTAADLDKDGDMDLAVTNSGSTSMSVFLNTTLAVSPVSTPTLSLYTAGVNDALQVRTADDKRLVVVDARGNLLLGDESGSSADMFETKVGYTAGEIPFGIASADFDKDGDVDLVTTSYNDSAISVFMNRGDGTYASRVTYTMGSGFGWSVVTADFNKDGAMDIAVVTEVPDVVGVFLNSGTGTFAAMVTYAVAAGGDAVDLVAADLDKDGDIDIATANSGTSNVSVLKNNGNGTFAAKVDYATTAPTYGITAGDFDKDGDLDLAATVNGVSDFMTILPNSGTGTFPSATDYAANSSPGGITAGDFDKDGDIDVASTSVVSDSASVYLNNGSGTFAAKVDYTTAADPNGIVAADLDKDGDLDLTTANDGTSTAGVSVLLGNGNGTFAAKFDYPSPSYAVTAADLDKDGDLDLAVADDWFNTASVMINNTLSNSRLKILSGDGSATLFKVNESGVYVGNIAADSNGTLLVLDDKNTTGDPTGVNGAMYYNSFYGRFRCYQNNAWVDCIGGSPKEYLRGEMRTVQNTAGEIDAGDHIKFANVQASAGASASLDTASSYVDSASTAASVGRITLAAGKTYRLVGNIPYLTCTAASTNCEANYTWYNVTGAAQLGSTSILVGTKYNSDDARGGFAEAIFTPSVTSLVELRIVQENSVTGFGYVTPPQLLYPNFYVEVISDGGSGGANAAEYMRAEMVTQQTTNVAAADHLKLESVAASSGSSISLDTAAYPSLGRISLAAGKTYRLTGQTGGLAFSASGCYAMFQWYNVTSSSYIGNSSFNIPTTYANNEVGTSIIDGVVTTNAATTVEMRIRSIAGGCTISAIDYSPDGRKSYAFVEVLSDGTKIAQFQGATASLNGQSGYVPMPTAGQQGSLLLGDGTWSTGLTLLNNTSLGIGIAAPTSKLHIYEGTTGGTSLALFRDNPYGSAIEILSLGTDTPLLRSGSNDSLNFATNNSSTVNLSLSTSGAATFQNTTDSVAAFSIKNATGNSVISIDTTADNPNNLISNPSFETNTTGWAAKGTPTTFARDATTGWDGSASLKFTTQAVANQGAQYNVTLTDSTTYTASLYMTHDAAFSSASVDVGYSSDGTTDNTLCTGGLENFDINDAYAWRRYTCSFTTPASHSGTPYFFVRNASAQIRSLSIDAVMLQPESSADRNFQNGTIKLQGTVSTPLIVKPSSNTSGAFAVQNASGSSIISVDTSFQIPDGGVNQVTNPDFEVNSVGWAAVGTGTTATRSGSWGMFGSSSLKVVTGTVADSGAKFTTGNTDPTQLFNGNDYFLSWYVWSATSNFTDMIAAYSADGTAGGEVNCTSINTQIVNTTLNGNWVRMDCEWIGIASAPTASSYIIIKQDTSTSARTFYIDGVLLEERQGSTVDATYFGPGRIQLNGTITSPVRIQTSDKTTTAFSILDESGQAMFNVDTTNWRLDVKDVNSKSLFEVKDLTPLTGDNSFGGAATSGAFITRNSYWGEEYNVVQTNNCSRTATANGWKIRGDYGANNGGACTAGNGEVAFSSVIANANAPLPTSATCTSLSTTGACGGGTPSAVNGIERISAAGNTGASQTVASLEYIASAAAGGTASGSWVANNRPIFTAKVKPSLTASGSNARYFIGLGDKGAASGLFPTNGIFFSNCTATAVPACTGTSWIGVVTTTGGGVVGTVTCSGTISTSQYAFLRIEVRSNTDIHFYVDTDVSAGGTDEQECGSGLGITGTGPAATGLTLMLESAFMTNTATNANLDVDFVRIWQDDPAANPTEPGDLQGQSQGNPVGAGLQAPSTSYNGTTNGDISEVYLTDSAAGLEVGDIVAIDEAGGLRVRKSNRPYDSSIIGVVSASSMQVLGESNENGVNVASWGRAPVKVSTENGAIMPGDLLTSSSQPGVAMKATAEGVIIGQALEAYNTDGVGKILVRLNVNGYKASVGATDLQTGSFDQLTIGTLSVGGDLNVSGNATFHGLTTVADIVIEGHVLTAGTAPIVVGLPALGSNSTISIEGNDVAGTITVVAGDDPNADDLIKVVFHRQFGATPRIVLTPVGKGSAALQVYVGETSLSDFIIGAGGLPPVTGQTYKINYQVLQ